MPQSSTRRSAQFRTLPGTIAAADVAGVLRTLAIAFDEAATTCHTRDQAAAHILSAIEDRGYRILHPDQAAQLAAITARITGGLR